MAHRNHDGFEFEWQLSNARTAILSNKKLATYERKCEKESDGCVIVWARWFLSKGQLYEQTRDNIKARVHYLFILDGKEYDNFNKFLARLLADGLPEALIREQLDALFVKPILSLGNYVVLNPDSPDNSAQALAAMIHHELPFAWIRQDNSRAREILLSVRTLLKELQRVQSEGSIAADITSYKTIREHPYFTDRQLCDFRAGTLADENSISRILSLAHMDLSEAKEEMERTRKLNFDSSGSDKVKGKVWPLPNKRSVLGSILRTSTRWLIRFR